MEADLAKQHIYDDAPDTKECKRCHRILDKYKFSIDQGNPDNLCSFCKQCVESVDEGGPASFSNKAIANIYGEKAAENERKSKPRKRRMSKATYSTIQGNQDTLIYANDIAASNQKVLDRAKVLQDYQDYELTNKLHRRGFTGSISKNIQLDI